jgi:hypothetical protein
MAASMALSRFDEFCPDGGSRLESMSQPKKGDITHSPSLPATEELPDVLAFQSRQGVDLGDAQGYQLLL